MQVARLARFIVALSSGCSLSVGAGAQGSLGEHSVAIDPRCNGFEACSRLHGAARERAERCHQTSSDCDTEDKNAALSYLVLLQQTEKELESLRLMARDARQETEAVRQAEQAACAERVHELEARRGAPSADGWFVAPTPN